MTFRVRLPIDSPGVISYRCSIVTESLSPTIFEIIGIFHIWVTTLTFLGHATSSVTWAIDPPYVISHWCPIVTKLLFLTVFEILGPKSRARAHTHTDTRRKWFYILSHAMYCIGHTIRRPAHVTTSSIRPFDSPYPIYYSYSIATKSVSPPAFEIMHIKHNGVTTLTFLCHVTSSAMWPFHSRASISYRWTIVTKSESAAVFEIWTWNIFGSRPWPFWITWRHQSRDQLIPRYPYPIGTKSLSPAAFEILDIKHIRATTLTFLLFFCHVTSSVTWTLDSEWVISYWWSFGPMSLSLTIS